MWYATEKILLSFFVVLCFVFSLHYTDGKTSIVIRSAVPNHVAHDEIYAHSFVHGAPMRKYRVHRASSRSVRDIWQLRARRENSLKNYASRYKTWLPKKEFGPRRPYLPPVKRRRPIPHPSKYAENEILYSRRPDRPHKHRVNSLQRPVPPSEINDDVDAEDYFPEETKRAEAQYEYRDGPRRPLKKRRNPAERKKKPKKPISYVKPTYDDDRFYEDERKNIFNEERPDIIRQKPKRQPTVSYSSFIQHSPGDVDYDYQDDDDVRQVAYRKKKRRIKKKTNKNKEEEEFEEYRPEYSPEVTRYPSVYTSDDDYEVASRTKVKLKKFKPESQPIYGEGHISHQSQGYSPNLFQTSIQEGFGAQSSQKVQPFNPYPQAMTSITNPSQGYRPSYESSYYPQPNTIQYNKITQPSHDYSVYGYRNSNAGQYVPNSYLNSPVTTYESLIPSSTTNAYQKYRNYEQQSSQSSVYYSPSLSYHKDVTTSYKTSPAYDSTDTFKDFNSNASNQKKYATYSSRYSESSGIVPSVQITERPDQESDFLRKHQNLYNNGISGVPIQGDGYMNQETKKDYDIGYGEFQFDENPA